MTKIPRLNQSQPIERSIIKKEQKTAPKQIDKKFYKDIFINSSDIKYINTEKRTPLINLIHNKKLSSKEKEYFKAAELRRKPDSSEIITIKSHDRSFNHSHEYAIEDNFLWFRKRGEKDWQSLYFDGFSENEIPLFIDCDGANLIIKDNHHKIHYKKILEEFRNEELDYNKYPELKSAQALIGHEPYVAIDTNNKNNWFKAWFTLPVLSSLVHLFQKKSLHLSPSYKAVAISHRGRYNDFVEDKLFKRHPVDEGVTTLYALDKNGQDIHKFDPWSPSWAHAKISLPETEDSAFLAHNISASASTIMAVGYDYNFKNGKQDLKIITKLADIDTEGGNPSLKYSFDIHNTEQDVRILPMNETWQEHPIILSNKAMITKNITIRQIGEGNSMRELRVEGLNNIGQPGYYRKLINDNSWSFVESTYNNNNKLSKINPFIELPKESSVKNYSGTFNNEAAQLFNFGNRSNHAQISCEIDGKLYNFSLHKRLSFAQFLGLDSYRYDLVLPEHDETLERIFGNKKSFEVRVKEWPNEIEIKSKRLSLHPFSFHFYPK
jgi:hypothetical protein